MSLLLTLNIFHTFFSVSIVDFEQVNVCWVYHLFLIKESWKFSNIDKLPNFAILGTYPYFLHCFVYVKNTSVPSISLWYVLDQRTLRSSWPGTFITFNSNNVWIFDNKVQWQSNKLYSDFMKIKIIKNQK